MHHANHFYGHAHIMARYVGLAEPPRIWGYLQHGWNMHDGFAVGTVFAPRYPKLVWSQACARRGWADGLRNYVTVGAPWLYLLEMERQAEWLATAPERTGTIVYPFHGWEGQQVVGSHAAFVEEIKQIEGDVPITVCLYWNEYDNPKVRREYEDSGVRVITHGQRGYLWQGTEPGFLYRQLDEMRRHRRVVSNRMSSAILYGASAGLEVGVYGDPMELESDHAILGGVSKPRKLFPELHQFAAPADYAAQVAATELGAAYKLPPEEILDVFGWSDVLSEPGPWPPAPPLEELTSPAARKRARRNSAGSHQAPGAAEPSLMISTIEEGEASDPFEDAGEVEETVVATVESASTESDSPAPVAPTPTSAGE